MKINHEISNIQQLAYFDIAVNGNHAWFCNYSYAAICKMDLLSHKISLEAFIPDCGKNHEDLYGPIAYYHETLILAPRCADRILLYHLSQKTFQEIPVLMDVLESDQRYKLFMNIIMMGDSAYLLPCRYPAVIKLDMNTLQLTYYDSWYQELKKDLREPNRFIFGRAAVGNNYECLFPVWQNNLLMQFDLQTGEYVIHRIFENETSFSAVAFDGENYWIVPRNKNVILKWEQKSHIIVYNNFPANFNLRGDVRFIALECVGEEIIAIPKYGSGNMIVSVDKKTGKCKKIQDILTNPIQRLKENVFGQGIILCGKKIDENKLIIFSDFDGRTLEIDLKFKRSIAFETVFEEEIREVYAQHILSDRLRNVLIENKEILLEEYIRYIKSHIHNNVDVGSFQMNGEKIFRQINSLTIV